MSWHDLMNIPGPDHLREALTNCEDPLQAIEEFQEQNGILLPSLKSALHFVDLHGVARAQFNQTVVEQLRDKLLQKVETLAANPNKANLKVLNELLVKSFKLVKYKPLQPVTMAILKHLPQIKVEYLQAILDDRELYKEVAIEVKQQIWQDNQTMFCDEVIPLLKQYIEEKENLLYVQDDLKQTFFTPSPKARRQNRVVQKLTEMVGRNITLYDMLLQFLRTLFLRTRTIHYCTLRAEMLMALHEAEIVDITSVDPCHKFTWCLDACIRERQVDSKRARELQGFLDSIRRGQEQVLGDLSMILADPYAMHTISMSAMTNIHALATGEALPRSDEELVLLLRMLLLGMKAWQMIDSQVFKETKVETQLIVSFLPCLLGLIIDDQLNAINNKTHEEILVALEPVPKQILSYSRNSAVGGTMCMYYILHACKQKDAVSLARLLPVLSQGDGDIVYQDIILHLLVSHLINMDDSFAYPFFYEPVIDNFFVPGISLEHVLKHLIRLLWCIHLKIPGYQLKELLLKIKPSTNHSIVVHENYNKLLERIDSYHATPLVAHSEIHDTSK